MMMLSLQKLVLELRANAATDLELAQRVAMTCCKLADESHEPAVAILTVFRISEAKALIILLDGATELVENQESAVIVGVEGHRRPYPGRPAFDDYAG